VLQRKLFYGAGSRMHTATGRAIRLCQHSGNLMFRDQGRERTDGKLRRSGKNNFH
jgi:hypothetical protein